MKRSWLLFFVLLLTFTACITACGKKDNNSVDKGGICNHSFGEWTVDLQPTCTEKGERSRQCSVCLEKETEKISATGHSVVIDAQLNPSCDQTGLTEGKHCSVCKEVFTAQSILPLIAHTYDNKYDENCNVCGFVRDAECEHINKITLEASAPTCTAPGYTEGSQCEKCKDLIIPQTIIPPLGHNYVDDVCSRCGHKNYGGLYDKDNKLLATWDELVNVYGMDVSANYTNIPGQADGVNIFHIDSSKAPNSVLEYHAKLSGGVKLVIPDTVKQLGEMAFAYCDGLVSVVLPNGIEEIPPLTFMYSKNLMHVEIPDGVKGIGHSTFTGCENLTYLSLPDSVTEIGEDAFSFDEKLVVEIGTGVVNYMNPEMMSKTEITHVTFGENVKSISQNLFQNCTSLKTVTITAGVTSLGYKSFSGCTSLESVLIPASVKYINDTTFENCENLKSVYIEDLESWCDISVYNSANIHLFNDANLIINDAIVTELVIPNSVERIRKYVFSGFGSIISVEISDSTTAIDEEAFINCSNLKTVKIGSGLDSIGDLAFYKCTALTSITVDENNSSYKSVDGDLYSKDGKTLLQYAIGKGDARFEIPKTVTKIAPCAFAFAINLNSVVIHDDVTDIGENAFSECNSLTAVIGKGFMSIDKTSLNVSGITKIDISYNNVDSIIAEAFKGYDKLDSVIIGSTVASIGDSAFYGCENLKSLDIPDAVTVIGNYVFFNCRSFTSMSIHKNIKSINANAFIGCSDLESFSIDDNNSYYKSVDGNIYNKSGRKLILYAPGKSDSAFVIPDRVDSIGSFAFANAGALDQITIHNNVKSIDENALYGSPFVTAIVGTGFINIGVDSLNKTGITRLDVSYNNIIIIPSSAFKGYTNLDSVTIGTKVTTISDSAFENCINLKEIILPDNVTSVGKNAFSGCDDLIATVGEGFSRLSASSQNDSGITRINIVSYIGSSAFCDFTNLTYVNIGDTVTSIGSSAFKNCIGLTEMTIGNSVTTIYANAFEGCTNLSSVTIPNSTKNIGSAAFKNCIALESVLWNNGIESIGDNAFEGCRNLISITIPNSAKTIGSAAFKNCTALESVLWNNGIETIGDNAFEGCNNISSITIPDGIKQLGANAFLGCEDLTAVVGNGFVNLGASQLKNTGLKKIDVSYNNVTSIPDSAFSGCSNFESVRIGESVTNIGTYAFSGCSGIKSISILGNITCIEKYAFNYCSSLESVSFLGSVKTIEERAFARCSSLVSIDISSAENLESKVFDQCSALVSIKLGENLKTIETPLFNDCPKLSEISIDESNQYYKAINGVLYSKDGKTILMYAPAKPDTAFEIPSTVTTVGSYAFNACSNLKSITLPGALTTIEENAFYECTAITSITIPDSVTNIGEYAFSGCKALSSVKLSKNISEISSGMFGACSSLTAIELPNGITRIDVSAFGYCTSLKEIVIPNSVTNIDKDAFANCESLVSVKLSSNLKYIMANTFDGCISLTSISIPKSVTMVQGYAFNNCTALTDIYYAGTEEEWKNIYKSSSQINATIHYNCVP